MERFSSVPDGTNVLIDGILYRKVRPWGPEQFNASLHSLVDEEPFACIAGDKDVWLVNVKIKYMGTTQSYTLLDGTGDYPYDCIAADKHPYPDNVCYIRDGGWLPSYKLKRTGFGMYRYDQSTFKNIKEKTNA